MFLIEEKVEECDATEAANCNAARPKKVIKMPGIKIKTPG